MSCVNLLASLDSSIETPLREDSLSSSQKIASFVVVVEYGFCVLRRSWQSRV